MTAFRRASDVQPVVQVEAREWTYDVRLREVLTAAASRTP